MREIRRERVKKESKVDETWDRAKNGGWRRMDILVD